MKEFKVGDKVEFEMMKIDDKPRWDYGHDRGGTGKWISGTVTSIYSYGDIIVQTKTYSWVWPNPSSNSKLYENPGYLRHKHEEEQKQVKYRLVDMGGYTSLQEI